MTARNYSSTAAATTLSAACNDSTTSLSVTATTGFPSAPFTLVIDSGTVDQEIVLVTAVGGTTLTVTRGYDSTSAIAHDLGAPVQHCHAAIDFREASQHVNATTAVHGVTSDLVGTSDTQTLSNKTVNLANNTVTGTKAQFNAAISDADMATLTGTETLTNKTLSLGSNTVTMTKAQLNTAVTDADVATLTGTETLTNKDLSSGTNTFPSSLATDAEVTSAVSSGVATHAALTATHGATGAIVGTTNTQTLENKTMGAGSVGTGTFRDSVDARVLTGRALVLVSNASQNIPNSSSWSKVDLTGTPNYDSGFFTYASSEVTIPSDGLYAITATLALAGSNTTGLRRAVVETYTGADPGVGSGTFILSDERPPSSRPYNPSLATEVFLASGTKVRLLVVQTSGGTLTVSATLDSRLSIRKVAS